MTVRTATRAGRRRRARPPAGGWPRLDRARGTWGSGVGNLDFDLGDLQDTGAALAGDHLPAQ